MDPNALVEKWQCQWERLWALAGQLALDDEQFWQFHAVLRNNERLQTTEGQSFLDLILHGYTTKTLVGLRVMADRDKKTVSLHRLLMDMQKHSPAVLTRERHAAMYRDDSLRFAHADFDRLGAEMRDHSRPDDFLSRASFSARMQLLDEATKRVHAYTNNYVTHLALKPNADAPAYFEIRAALRSVGDILCDLALILRGASTRLKPIRQYNWLRVLQFPWCPQGRVPDGYVPLEDVVWPLSKE